MQYVGVAKVLDNPFVETRRCNGCAHPAVLALDHHGVWPLNKRGIGTRVSASWRGCAVALPRRFQRCHGRAPIDPGVHRLSRLETLQAFVKLFWIRCRGCWEGGSAIQRLLFERGLGWCRALPRLELRIVPPWLGILHSGCKNLSGKYECTIARCTHFFLLAEELLL